MNDGIDALLGLMSKIGASALHLTVGLPPVYRVNGEIKSLSDFRGTPEASALARRIEPLKPENVNILANQLLTSDRHRQTLTESGSANLTRSIAGVGRFRVNVYTQRGSLAVVCHALFEQVPSLDVFYPGLREYFCEQSHGLLLVAGPMASGKTTLLAAVVNHINQTEARHILVVEDPIEYLHNHKKSLVNQRQVGEDVRSYSEALDAAMDQDADVIVSGDLPDGESVIRAISAAETGRIVFAAVPVTTAKEAVNRLTDMAPGLNGRLTNVLGGIVVLERDHAARVVSREVVTVD